MISHIPHSSRIFLGLLIISLLLSYIAITLSYYQERLAFDYGATAHHQNTSHAEPISTVDTKGWVSYHDSAYPLTFSHPADWKIVSKMTAEKIYSIDITIPNVVPHIVIYIDETGYVGLDGLQKKSYSLPNLEGISVNENLIGVKTGEYYYTFDASMNTRQLPEFTYLMKTVVFE